MQVHRTSLWSGKTRTRELAITPEQYARWQSGTVIQTAMPQLTVEEREFVISGMTGEEWAAMSQGEDDEEDTET